MSFSATPPAGDLPIPEWVAPSDAEIGALTDELLLRRIEALEALSRRLDVAMVRYSSEVARRSRRELGNQGLAARQGHLNPESLIQALTRSSLSDASRRIRVGGILADVAAARLAEEAAPLGPIAAAVVDGRLGVDGADQVVRALTPILDETDGYLLGEATLVLATEAAVRDADCIGVLARGVRDTLDRAGVIGRERTLRSRRSLRRGRVADGLRRVTLVLDPESDAIIMGAIDHAMSPRLGGPRFTSFDDTERADALLQDSRTNEQLALDTLVDLVRIGVDRDDGTVLGATKPAARVTITLNDLTRAVDDHGAEHPGTDTGVGWLEGSHEPVSAATARRMLCDAGALPIVLSGLGEPLDVGRTRRLFTGPQRVALANRDGGCRMPGCDRPPSWTEAHHITPFSRNGLTDLRNGVLLCRRHHLLLHDGGWQITFGSRPGDLLLIPPATVDPNRTPRPMPDKLPQWIHTGEHCRPGFDVATSCYSATAG